MEYIPPSCIEHQYTVFMRWKNLRRWYYIGCVNCTFEYPLGRNKPPRRKVERKT